ncbi:MAG: chorismate mutase [Geodermatophilaceae bacterium]
MTPSTPTPSTQTPSTPTPSTQTPSTPTPLTQLQTDEAIGELRVEIDAVDAALVELVARRIQISKQVGRLRMAAGGTRLSLAREQAVVARFSAELGETGTSLAMLLLRAGRGRL